MDGGTGSFGLCVDKCIEHLFEKKYIEGVRHAGGLGLRPKRTESTNLLEGSQGFHVFDSIYIIDYEALKRNKLI